jgi:hypothetical protein
MLSYSLWQCCLTVWAMLSYGLGNAVLRFRVIERSRLSNYKICDMLKLAYKKFTIYQGYKNDF